MRTSLVQSLAKFMADPEQLERTFTGEESVNADDSYKFKQEVMRLAASESVKWVRDIEGSVTVSKTFNKVEGADLSVQTPSLQKSDDQSAAVQKTPNRISLEAMKARVADIEYIHPTRIPTMTICVVTIDNGFVLVGKSAAADPANHNAELGRQFAYEDALRQMWPLEAYLLRERMSNT